MCLLGELGTVDGGVAGSLAPVDECDRSLASVDECDRSIASVDECDRSLAHAQRTVAWYRLFRLGSQT